MEKSEVHFGDTIISAFKKATIQLEDLQIQMALGKAEASDKYDEFKKSLNHTFQNARIKLRSKKNKVEELRHKLETLEKQFNLSKIKTKEVLKEQTGKIDTVIREIEELLEKK